MLTVTNLKVSAIDTDYNELTWEIEDTNEDVLDYTFQVVRSESVSGPWDTLTVPFEDRYRFQDRHKPSFHESRQLQYKLVVTHKKTKNSEEFGPVDVQPVSDLIALEIRRHMTILMREFVGRKTWLFPVRTFGQRCPLCWNKTLSKRSGTGCGGCFDTGFARGYMKPIEMHLQVDTGGNLSEQNTNVGTTQQQNTTARVVYFGPIKPRDVIVEAENYRWRVVSVNQTEHTRAPVHLELQLHLIPPSDIEYALPLKFDREFSDLTIGPARNLTNPQNLDSVGNEEIPDVFALYPQFLRGK
jgi:hypothetical protein